MVSQGLVFAGHSIAVLPLRPGAGAGCMCVSNNKKEHKTPLES